VTSFGPDSAEDLDTMSWPTLHGRIEGALRLEVEHFLAAVADGTPFLVPPEAGVEAVRSAALLEKACTVRRLP
jgi:hypothetical protein